MTELLEKAFTEIEKLPDSEQNNIAYILLRTVYIDIPNQQEIDEWERLTSSRESQVWLDDMAEKVRQDKKKGRIFDIDPSHLAK